MSHSKRNTSLAFFTSHERSLLKSHWGSQSTRLSRDSFLPFASCNLCLQPSISPVACAANGEVFCRECAVSNLLAQRKEIKRLEKEGERRTLEEEEQQGERAREEGVRAVREFERTMLGLEGGDKKKQNGQDTKRADEEQEEKAGRGVKRKFELDEDTMLKNAQDERAKARRAIEDEKAAKATLPSFWVPSLAPATGEDTRKLTAPPKLAPLCPGSSLTDKHTISLKTLVDINFKKAAELATTKADTAAKYICPACDKTLSNTLKAVMAVPCGHVLCRPCAGKFMSADAAPLDPHAELETRNETEGKKGKSIVCYVCEADLSVAQNGKRDPVHKKAEKLGVRAGVVELRSEGTGFAGGGGNMVKAQGTAFQC